MVLNSLESIIIINTNVLPDFNEVNININEVVRVKIIGFHILIITDMLKQRGVIENTDIHTDEDFVDTYL
jgi:hypothetical protein